MRTSTAIALGVTLNFALIYSDLMAWLRLGAPFVPSAGNKIDAAFGMLPPGTRRTHMVDLGSGAGAVVRAAVREAGFSKATGYEVNGALVSYARLRSLFSPGETSARPSTFSRSGKRTCPMPISSSSTACRR